MSKTRWVVGTHALKEVLKVRPKKIKQIIFEKGFDRNSSLRDLAALCDKQNLRIQEKHEAELKKLSMSHQGAAFEVDGLPEWNEKDLESAVPQIYLALDEIEDPHNLGAVLRTAWLMGVKAIFITARRSVQLTPTVHKVASGGAEHVAIVEVPQFEATFKRLKDAGFWIYGLSEKSSTDIGKIQFPNKTLLVLGSEEKGLRTTTQKLCDDLVSLPQTTNAASYNVSVAAAMVIFETFRQQRNSLTRS